MDEIIPQGRVIEEDGKAELREEEALRGAGPSRVSSVGKFLRFGGLSGLGWIVDFVLLYLLVRTARLPVFTANLISATTAATFVFLVSRRLVFSGRDDLVLIRVLIYGGYTLGVIVVASFVMKYAAVEAGRLGEHFQLRLSVSSCAMLAKVIVTPINFGLNYVVAGIVSEHDVAR